MNTDAGYVFEGEESNHCQYSLAAKRSPSLKPAAHLYRPPLGLVPDISIQPSINCQRDRWNRKNQVILRRLPGVCAPDRRDAAWCEYEQRKPGWYECRVGICGRADNLFQLASVG